MNRHGPHVGHTSRLPRVERLALRDAATAGPWRASALFPTRIVTMNPIGQFHVAYATRIRPNSAGGGAGSW